MRIIGAVAALLIGAMPLPASAQGWPEAVADDLDQIRQTCVESGGRFTLRDNAVTATDLNGDGRPDFVVDQSAMSCAGVGNGEGCPRNGCALSVYLSGRNVELAMAFDEPALGWRTVAGPQGTTRIEIDEAQCEGWRGACTRTYEASGTDMRQVALRPFAGAR